MFEFMSSRLRKSHNDRMITGVCGGIAEYLDWDPTIVRIIFVAVVFLGWGTPILLYFILALIMPD